MEKYTGKIEKTINDWGEVVENYQQQKRAIEANDRLTAEAKRDDIKALKDGMQEQSDKYYATLRNEWKTLKEYLVREDQGDVEAVANALVVIRTIGDSMTPDIFDSLITESMKNNLGTMNQLRAAVDAAGLYDKVAGCKAMDVLFAYEAMNREVLDCEKFSYTILQEWRKGLKFGISKALLLQKLGQFEQNLVTMESGRANG